MSAYGTFVQVLLTAIIPLAFINFYPATVLLSKSGQVFPGWLGWFAPLIGPISFWIAYQAWMHGVNKYQSAGG
jgi:ABC-2 type transport system permease protein